MVRDKIDQKIYEFHKSHMDEPKGIVMNPKTWNHLLAESGIPFIPNDTNLKYRGLKVYRSVDIEHLNIEVF